MLWLFSEVEKFSNEELSKYECLLSLERVKKSYRFRFFEDRRISQLAYLLLLYGLVQEYGIRESVEFYYSKENKPYLIKYPYISFNLSHSRCGVLLCLSHSSCGCDIQEIDAKSIIYSKKVFTEGEINLLQQSENPSRLFSMFWTLKESYLKWIGKGFLEEPKIFDFSKSDLKAKQDDDIFDLKIEDPISEQQVIFNVYSMKKYCCASCINREEEFFSRKLYRASKEKFCEGLNSFL